MILSAAQLTALLNDITNDATLNAIPKTSDGFVAIAAAYNLAAAPNFLVYRTNVPVQDIYDQIVWANLTPTDAPDGTQLWLNRAMHCQGKQFNVQIILQGQTVINAAKANVRAGLQDALTNVPSGANGTTVSAGWVGVRDNALTRTATRGEKLFATATVQQDGTTPAKAATMTQEGSVSAQNVQQALGL
jgi:hypothetical protein